MVQPLRDSRDHYEELKQIDDAMSQVYHKHPTQLNITIHINTELIKLNYVFCLQAQKKKTESMSLGGKKK